MSLLTKFFTPEIAHAHCDVPCGIYDPITAQIAALSVIRMTDQICALKQDEAKTPSYLNTIARYISVKESEAEKCKHEIRIIWGDFIKAEHLEKYPQLHTIAHNIMALGGAVKQNISRDSGLKLLDEVNKFAEIFWEIKGVKTKKAKAPYLPAEEVVYPIL